MQFAVSGSGLDPAPVTASPDSTHGPSLGPSQDLYPGSTPGSGLDLASGSVLDKAPSRCSLGLSPGPGLSHDSGQLTQDLTKFMLQLLLVLSLLLSCCCCCPCLLQPQQTEKNLHLRFEIKLSGMKFVLNTHGKKPQLKLVLNDASVWQWEP